MNHIELRFKKLENTQTEIDNFKDVFGEFSGNCGIQNFRIVVNQENKDIKKTKLSSYSLSLCLICFLSLINSISITLKLGNSEANAKSISLIAMYSNMVWDSVGCLVHFFLSLNYPLYFKYFLFPTVLYFLNFSVTDLRLLYTVWFLKYKSNITDANLMRKKLLKLYFLFYAFMFFALFYVRQIFFNKTYVIISILLTWTPQIIYNVYNKNKISFPFIYILFISFSRLFLPCYFRGCSNNFFMIAPDYSFIFICVLMMLILIVIYYSQIILGPRWFMPCKCRISDISQNKFTYINLKELLAINADYKKSECVICLTPLISEGSTKVFTGDFVSLEEKETVENIKEEKVKFLKEFLNILTDFHEKKINFENRKYVLTPCKHIFHSQCLLNWFQWKKECPVCRTDLNLELAPN